MLVQQPNSESLPRLSAGEVLAEFGKTGAIVLTQHPDVGHVHVQQPRVVGYTMITYLKHVIPPWIVSCVT